MSSTHKARPFPADQPISVTLIGAGGNGSAMLTHLARIHTALTRGGFHPHGLQVTVFDPDEVTSANLGRQMFAPSDLGQNKAEALIARTNLFFGTRWKAIPTKFNTGTVGYVGKMPIAVSCVDTIAARLSIHRVVHRWHGYWMDLGNSQHTGQVVLGETEGDFKKGTERKHRLPHLFDLYPKMKKQRDKKTEPSCSLAEALSRQDLFINSTLTTFAGQLLWQLLRHGSLQHQGVFVNLTTGRTAPLAIK